MVYLVAFAGSLALVALLVVLTGPQGLLRSRPGRGGHGDASPLVGGLAVGASCLACLPWAGGWPRAALPAFVLASGALLLLGAIEDRWTLPGWLRLAAQGAAALAVCVDGGVRIHSLGNLLGTGDIALGHLAVPFTVGVIVGVTVAFNLLDGPKGLPVVVAAGTLATMLLGAVWSGYVTLVPPTLLVTASLLGFLVWNLPLPGSRRPRVSLGRAGSTWIGFALACLAILLTQRSPGTLHPVLAVWLLAVPVFDALSLIAHRLAPRRGVLGEAPRNLHRLLREAGWTAAETTVVTAAASVLLGVLGLALDQFGVPDYVSAALAVGLFLAYHLGLRRLPRLSPESG